MTRLELCQLAVKGGVTFIDARLPRAGGYDDDLAVLVNLDAGNLNASLKRSAQCARHVDLVKGDSPPSHPSRP
jgi:hypothetical protein